MKKSELKHIIKEIIKEGADIRDLSGKDLIGVRFMHKTRLSDDNLKDLKGIIQKFSSSVNSPMRKPKLEKDELLEIFAKIVLEYL